MTSDLSTRAFAALVAALLAVALALRLAAIGVDGFWLDEIFGASYVNLDLLRVVIAVLRFDIHPPLYYVQLWFWGLPNASDGWLLGNSVAWSLVTLVAAAAAVRRMAGDRAALVTLAIGAVLGSEIHFATELRMYAMMSAVTVLAWWAADRWAGAPTRRAHVLLILALAVLTLLHSAAFVPISAVLLYALLARWRQAGPRAVAVWLVPAAVTAVLLAPWLVNASMRTVSHTMAPDLAIVARTIAGWLLGYGALGIAPVALQVVAAAVALLVVIGVLSAPSRHGLVLLAMVVWPVLIVAGISLALRPIWLDRTLAFCAPFLAIAAGLAGTRERAPAAAGAPRWAIAALAVACVGLVVENTWQARTPRKMQYRELAQALGAVNVAGLPVHVPSNATFWGVARYAVGPRWGGLFEIQDPVAPDNSQTWARLYQRIGEARLRSLGMLPRTRTLPSPAGPLWIGLSALPPSATAAGFWLVGDAQLAGSADACGRAEVIEARRFRGLSLLRCGPQGNPLS